LIHGTLEAPVRATIATASAIIGEKNLRPARMFFWTLAATEGYYHMLEITE